MKDNGFDYLCANSWHRSPLLANPVVSKLNHDPQGQNIPEEGDQSGTVEKRSYFTMIAVILSIPETSVIRSNSAHSELERCLFLHNSQLIRRVCMLLRYLSRPRLEIISYRDVSNMPCV